MKNVKKQSVGDVRREKIINNNKCEIFNLFNKSKLQEYISVLETVHAEGRLLLLANNKKLLIQETGKIFEQLLKKNIHNLGIKQLRYYAKRLEIKDTKIKHTKDLREDLIKVIQKFKNDKNEQKKIKSTKVLGTKRKIKHVLEFLPRKKGKT